MTLLGLLHLLAGPDRLRLAVGHVDHGLRPASADEAALVQRQAERLGVPVAVTRLRLAPGPGLPARARHARRAALRAQAQAAGASWVALGHTATDQAETVLLHLSRGAGLDGLSAMAGHDRWPDGEPGGVVRPLLDLPRAEARALAQRLSLPFVDDPTNDDRRHPRVRVRHEVLPVLRQHNPQVEAALCRVAAHARDAEAALGVWVERQWRSRRRPTVGSAPADPGVPAVGASARDGSGEERAGKHPVTSAARWSTEGIQQLPRAVRTRFVRRLCRAAGCPEDALAARTLASIDDALLHPGPRRAWDLHPRLRLCLWQGELWMEDAPVREPRGQPLTPSGGRAMLPEPENA